MADLEIKILTKAELSGARAAEAQLERDIGKAKALGQEYGHLETKLKRVQASIAASEAELSKSGKGDNLPFAKLVPHLDELGNRIPTLQAFTTAMSGALSTGANLSGGLTAGLAGLAATAGPVAAVAIALATAVKGIMEFAQAQEKVASLDQALANKGMLSDDYREKLQGLAGDFEEATNIVGDKWLGVLSTLTKQGADETNIEEYAEAVKNLAGFLETDVEQAAQVFTKAMHGNFEVLERHGIAIDDNASKQEKLKSIMEQLSEKGGGQLEARAKTLSGQFTELTNALSNFFEGVGNLINRHPILLSQFKLLAEGLKAINTLLPESIEPLNEITNAIVPTGEAAAKAGTDIGEMGTSAAGAGTGLTTLKGAADQAKEALKNASEAAKQLRREQDELIDAALAQKQADVDLLEAEGKISPEEASKRRSKNSREAASARIETQARELQDLKNLILKEINDAAAKAQAAREKTGSLKDQLAGALQAAGIDPEEVDAKGKSVNQSISQAEKALQAKQAEIAKQEKKIQESGLEANTPAMEQRLALLKNEGEALQGTLQSLEAERDTLQEIVNLRELSRQAAALENAATAEANNKNRINQPELDRIGREESLLNIKATTQQRLNQADLAKERKQEEEQRKAAERERLKTQIEADQAKGILPVNKQRKLAQLEANEVLNISPTAPKELQEAARVKALRILDKAEEEIFKALTETMKEKGLVRTDKEIPLPRLRPAQQVILPYPEGAPDMKPRNVALRAGYQQLREQDEATGRDYSQRMQQKRTEPKADYSQFAERLGAAMDENSGNILQALQETVAAFNNTTAWVKREISNMKSQQKNQLNP